MSTTLLSIDMTSGVNEDGVGFVTVAAHGSYNTILLGQMNPEEVRQHAMYMLQCAEAAEQDAAVLRICRKLKIDDRMAGLIITELRESREQDENPDNEPT